MCHYVDETYLCDDDTAFWPNRNTRAVFRHIDAGEYEVVQFIQLGEVKRFFETMDPEERKQYRIGYISEC